MQVGNSGPIMTIHCNLGGGCPNWGLFHEYHTYKEKTGYVCIGYWNNDRSSCLNCMNHCFSCADELSCNEKCED